MRKIEKRRCSASFPPVSMSVSEIVAILVEYADEKSQITVSSGDTIFEGSDEINAHAGIIALPLEVEMGDISLLLQRGCSSNTINGDAQSLVKVRALAQRFSEHQNRLSYWSTPYGSATTFLILLGFVFLPGILDAAQFAIASNGFFYFGLPVLAMGFWIVILFILQDRHCGNVIKSSSQRSLFYQYSGTIFLLVLGAFLTAAFEWIFDLF